MLNTVNAILRDNILDVHYKPGPIAKSLFTLNDKNLIENISPNISQTISSLYALLWPNDSFPKSVSSGLGYKTNIISFSDINITLLIIWICIWFILIILSCISIYNLLYIEHNQLSLFKYRENRNEINENINVHFVKNEKNNLFYKIT
jgi:hypothetical protein